MGRIASVAFLLCLLELILGAPAAEARHLKVYSPYALDKGEAEVAYWFDAFLDTPLTTSGPFPRKHLLRHTGELAYGLTDRWSLAAYLDLEEPTQGGSEQFTFVQYRFETIYRVFDQHDVWPAIALYVEYTLPRRQYEHRDEVEWKLLLERRIEDFMIRLNPVWEREFNDASRVRFGYEHGLYWSAKPSVRLGVEAFGTLGPLGSFPTANNQQHSVGPAIKFKFGSVGWGYRNPRTTLAVGVLARGRVPVDQEFFLSRIRQAMALRERVMPARTVYRVVHGEADGLPGLIVDRYDDAVAIQLLTAGMDRRRELILTAVEEVLRPRTIVARNDSPMREREGLPRERAVLRGQIPPDPTVTIHGLDVVVDLLEGQKTGLFLDQIDNYPLIERMAGGAEVLG